ncbi:unnamed protein product [Hyaloperonospora brassicae]|uniref:Sulfatase N-terminal domain-containing protein n=1 Tax=Hyaloperonospora brassicae TaxID=162125 RepID=A0AAV0UZZ1_HYABA|nr:unnamed protein product [Hyaloperonospora brassicae]
MHSTLQDATESHGAAPTAAAARVDATAPTSSTTWCNIVGKSRAVRTSAAQDWPWLGWAFVYVYSLVFLFAYRCSALSALMEMYADATDGTLAVLLGALLLGALEDFVCVTYFVCLLWAADSVRSAVAVAHVDHRTDSAAAVRTVTSLATFATSWTLFMATMLPFVADVVVVQLRDMRFTFDLIVMAIQEKDSVSSFDVSPEQLHNAYANATVIVVAASCFALVRTLESWTDLARWNPTQMWSDAAYTYDSVRSSEDTAAEDGHVWSAERRRDLSEAAARDSAAKVVDVGSDGTSRYVTVEIDDVSHSADAEDAVREGEEEEDDDDDDTAQMLSVNKHKLPRAGKCQMYKQTLVALMGLTLLSIAAVAVSSVCSPLVAYLALNTTLNEMLGRSLQPALDGDYSLLDDGKLPWAETFIHRATEKHKLYGNDTLYRRTTGFRGDLAFDVKVSAKDPPNVLLLVIESFRFHDSRYLVGKDDPSNLFRGTTNVTVTPNFDRWAQRGIGLRNHWSSWRTSRSVESLLFGQLPYDHVTKSGMTGGQYETKLAGLPQLFSAKGYETVFSTGCRTNYDSWDSFLPQHGFDSVWSSNEMKLIAERDYSIKRRDWSGRAHRAFGWGVHDDVSFQVLGDLMINKTKAQARRVTHGKKKKPMFLTHYTISSHVNYMSRPRWYNQSAKPDFSPLYKGLKHAANIKNYLEIRYFTDMEFGKFMDRMAAAGVLNDTIVVISGDHGQGPEVGNDVPQAREVSAMRVAGAIVAEGRLGKAAGLVLDDATEQYDILNTLADITGVPKGGFNQTGVGRSLKRKIGFGQRVVYSNDPARKMSLVRGHDRLRYDRMTDSALLHDVDKDHDMQRNLLPELPKKKQMEWKRLREAGRRINSYYTKRWQGHCLLAATCDS